MMNHLDPMSLALILDLGGRINGASPAYNAEEMSHALRTARTKFLVTLPDSLKAALEACRTVGIPKQHVFLLEGSHPSFRSIHDLMELAKEYDVAPLYRIPADQTNKEVCGYLSFSSGTTGLPKAVMLSHHNVIAQCHQVAQLRTELGERFKVLAIMPLFHITGLIRFCTYPVHLNGDCIMLPSFSMEKMLDAVVEFEVR
jgi:4-coumarate--CoA ligase